MKPLKTRQGDSLRSARYRSSSVVYIPHCLSNKQHPQSRSTAFDHSVSLRALSWLARGGRLPARVVAFARLAVPSATPNSVMNALATESSLGLALAHFHDMYAR